MGDIPTLIIGYAVRAVVLTLLLWAMIKVQRLKYSLPGMVGSAVLAAGLDMIPHYGHYAALPVLYLCIWKVTGASRTPDAIFTVVVAYALMFAVQVLVLTALTPPTPRAHPVEAKVDAAPALVPGKPKPDALPTPAPVPKPVPVPVPVPVPKPALKPVPNPVPLPVPAPPAASVAKPPPAAAPENVEAMTPSLIQGTPVSSPKAAEWLKNVLVKGSTENGDKSMLLISVNNKSYSLMAGEPVLVRMEKGACHMRLIEVSEPWAILEVNGETGYLRIH